MIYSSDMEACLSQHAYYTTVSVNDSSKTIWNYCSHKEKAQVVAQASAIIKHCIFTEVHLQKRPFKCTPQCMFC